METPKRRRTDDRSDADACVTLALRKLLRGKLLDVLPLSFLTDVSNVVQSWQHHLRFTDHGKCLQNLLRNTSLSDELEEAACACHLLITELQRRPHPASDERLTVFDMGSGKGYFSCLLLGLVRLHHASLQRYVCAINMIDHEVKGKIDLKHVQFLNSSPVFRFSADHAVINHAEASDRGTSERPITVSENPPLLGEARIPSQSIDKDLGFQGSDIIVSFLNVNIHDKSAPKTMGLHHATPKLVLVGIHLCKRISSRFIELFLWLKGVDIMILSPCCLPHGGPVVIDDCILNPKELVKDATPYATWCSFLLSALPGDVLHKDLAVMPLQGSLHRKNRFLTASRVVERVLPASPPSVPLSNTCTTHFFKGKCLFGKKCKFLHIDGLWE